MENIREILANNIKENRRRLGISQPRLAELADLSTHYVAMIESCRKFPTPDVLGRLAAGLGIEPHELFAAPPSPEWTLERLRQEVVAGIKEEITGIKQTVRETIQETLTGECKTRDRA